MRKNSGRSITIAALLAAVAFLFSQAGGAQETQPEEFPRELVEFVPYEHNPIFTGRGPGFWDERIRERGWIMQEGNTWRMWYTGYQPNGPMKLGYATSPDGIAWTRYRDSPLHDENWVEDMMVVRQGKRYYMFAEGLHDRAQLLTSGDGIRWSREGSLDIRRRDGQPISEGPYGTPTGAGGCFMKDGTKGCGWRRHQISNCGPTCRTSRSCVPDPGNMTANRLR